MNIELKESTRKGKKWSVTINGKTIHFGQKGSEDYTIHKDKDRKELYLKRHKKREDWTKKGILTAGYWAKWLLWNKPTIKESIKDIEKRHNVSIKYV